MIRRANQFVSFNFGDVPLLDILNFLGGPMNFVSFLKAHRTSETKSYFPCQQFDEPEKLNSSQFPPYKTFFSKLRNNNSLEEDNLDFQSLIDGA